MRRHWEDWADRRYHGLMGSPLSARDRLERAFARIEDPAGEGARTCLTVYRQAAVRAAEAADRRARAGTTLGFLDGVIVSIKDLFDVAGEPTRAGSTILASAPPAERDAPIVRRLRKAGAVIVAKTNMSEFAFTGIGANPHFGTPGNPADRARVPGGSSSGAAVAVADGMCEIAIGTDTGGSTRIPAALCGLVGYKPTKARVPTQGAFPLSPTLDSIGPIARTVEACAKADAVLAGAKPWTLEPAAPEGLRLGILQGLPLEDLDAIVAARFEDAISRLGRAGVRLFDVECALLDRMADVQSTATIATIEAFQVHRARLADHGPDYDPIVRSRIELGSAVSAAGHARMLVERQELVDAMDLALAKADAFVLPTTPIVAPTMDEVSSLDGFNRCNQLLLRNTAIANFFDLCAISLPMPQADALPAGIMLFARRGRDRRLFEIAAAAERLFSRR
jgi:aspartyl-tRNA(Asn)/glutamyl-tRNA(Gln) amidotransferase subunit A